MANRPHKGGTNPRLKDGLTVKEAQFCALLAQCYGKSEAYTLVYGRGRGSSEALYQKAHRLSQKPKVAARVDELLSAAKVDDIMQTGKVLRLLRDGMEMAIEQGNLSAFAAMIDRAMRHKALMSDRLVIDAESQLTDEQLIDALAGSNTTLKQQLMTVLHGKSGFDA